MPVLAIFTGKTVSKSQYEALRKEVNWESQQPAGVISHAASFDDKDNAHVVDVWASPEEMNAFVNDRLMPAFMKLKINPPDVQVYPLHNLNVYAAIDKYKI